LFSNNISLTISTANDQVLFMTTQESSAIGFQPTDGFMGASDDGLSTTIKASDAPAVAYAFPIHDQATRFAGKRGEKQDGKGNGFGIGENGNPMNTLTQGDRHAVATPAVVRRLTPVECERLQGFPDNWTADQADSNRYKQMGNAVTVNVINWIGQRL
jgi:DNA (cytosine-5)-methyltransferase 1